MPSLVRANIFQRKTRAAITILAVAIEVTAVILIVGLTNGTLNEISGRMQAVGADIMVQPQGSSPILGLSSLPVDERFTQLLADLDGVDGAAPIFVWTATFDEGAPVNMWGIDARLEGVGASLEILEGSNITYNGTATAAPPYEMVIDTRLAEAAGFEMGQIVRALDTDWRIVGIARAGIGARIFVPLQVVQELVGQLGKAHVIFVKAESLDQTGELAARIEAEFSTLQTTVVEEYTQALFENIGGLNVFRGAISGIAVSLAFLVILLAMYTSIIERTREIGILKALGGSKAYIVLTIMQEAMLLSLLGVIGGYGLARLLAWILTGRYPTLIVQFSWDWTLLAIFLGLFGGVLGSFYPAMRAARQDPVRALRDE